MNKKIILLISMFMMMLVLGSNVFALDSTQVPDIYISEVTITTPDNYGECLINIRLRNPLITIQQVHPWRARTVELCAHFVAADSDISVRSVFDNLNTYVENNKYNSSTRATIVNSGINKIYLAKSCAVSSNRYQLVIRDSSLCSKDNLLDVYVFQEFVDPNLWHTNMDLMDNIFYLNSRNELKSIDLGNKDSSNFFYESKPEFHYDYFNIDARFSKPITDQTPVIQESEPVRENVGGGSGNAGGTGGAGSTGAGGTGGAGSTGAGATGTYNKAYLNFCKESGYVEHSRYPVGLADGVPVGDGRTKTAEPGDYLYRCEESSVFGNTIRVTRCNPYTGDFGLGAGEPRGEVAISELHEQLCREIEQIKRAEEEQREAELYDTININYHIKQLANVIEAKENPIELSYNPEKTIFYLNYNRPAMVLNNLDLNFVLPQDFNSDKNTCYLITSLGQNTQADINTFFDKFTQENNYIEDSNALSNVNCNQITENNVMLRASRMEEKYFLALQKIDDTNILVTSAQIKFMNRELYLSYLRYEINKKIARFFCPSCNLPSIETPTEETQTFSYPQKTLRVLKEEAPVVADVDETAQTGNLITSFVINEVNGVINDLENAIKVTLPENTDLTNLTPTITVSQGATVDPASGVAQNFTHPVEYTVTPETGDPKVYTVVVNHSILEGGGADSGNLCGINKQQNLTEYINCLKNNFSIFGLQSQVPGFSGTVSSIIDNKYNETSNSCLNKPYNEKVFKVAKTFNFTLEETALLWSQVAAETSCDSRGDGAATCGDDCRSLGLGQIHIPSWSSEYMYNSLRNGFASVNLATISNGAYGGSNHIIENQAEAKILLDAVSAKQDVYASLIFSAVILKQYLYDLRSAPNIHENSSKIYDHDQSINMRFLTAFLYSRPADKAKLVRIGLGSNHKNSYESEILVRGNSSAYSLHKVAYYLKFKKYYYEGKISQQNTGFIQALNESGITQ